MKRYSTIILFTLIAVGLIFVGVTTAQKGIRPSKLKSEVKYPDGYRYWTHAEINGGPAGARPARCFRRHPSHLRQPACHEGHDQRPVTSPTAPCLVFDLYEAQRENNAIVEGPHKLVGVMQKHDKKYSATGGWGFEGFRGDSRERM